MAHGLYLCETWQGFLQQIVNNASHGYQYYSFSLMPEYKREKWANTDRKLIELFEADKTKDRRYKHKKAGKPNYAYLRYENMLVIMKTKGDEADPARLTQKFYDLRTHPLEIRPKDGELVLKVGRKSGEGFTVWLSKQYHLALKSEMTELLEKRQINQLKYKFNALNGIPAYAGTIEHKKMLLTFILKSAKTQGIALKRSDFRLLTKLSKYKVFTKD